MSGCLPSHCVGVENEWLVRVPFIARAPFASARKLLTHLMRRENGSLTMVLKFCTRVLRRRTFNLRLSEKDFNLQTPLSFFLVLAS